MSSDAPRYPLRAAQALRKSETERARRDVERAAAELAQAERELTVAREALQRQQEIARSAGEPAPTASSRSPTANVGTALELQREATFAARQIERARELRAAADAAQARVAERRALVSQRKQGLSSAHGAEQVLQRDAERFEQQERKRAETREQHEHDERRGRTPNL
jgi:hypothetical protein